MKWDIVSGPMDRRDFLRAAAMAGAGLALGSSRRLFADEGAATRPSQQLVRYPQKTDLILLTDRPPNLETPLEHFRSDFTPNEAFFVRWHIAGIPTSLDEKAFRLSVDGHVDNELSLSPEQLQKDFEPVSLPAVNQCSGNSRQYFSPRVPGGQWGNGALGNAMWKGVRLSDLLKKAGIKSGAVDVTFQGLDKAPLPSVPLFIKSLAVDHANDGQVMVAYEMNGKPLPMLNGFPLRLIVPGWYATYWVKSLADITVTNKPFKGFWMEKSYRVPDNPEYQESPADLAKVTVPISRILVRSLFVSPAPAADLRAGTPVDVEGLALDAGSGIKKVELSTDAGRTWQESQLDPEIGKFSWRRWRSRWTPAQAGPATLTVRATSNDGRTQPGSQNWNRSGYARHQIESIEVTVK